MFAWVPLRYKQQSILKICHSINIFLATMFPVWPWVWPIMCSRKEFDTSKSFKVDLKLWFISYESYGWWKSDPFWLFRVFKTVFRGKNDLRNFGKYKLDSTDRIDFKIRFQQQRNRVYIFVSFTWTDQLRKLNCWI